MLQPTARSTAPWKPVLASHTAHKTPFDALGQRNRRIVVKRGEEIYAEGDPATYCYKLVSGSVRLVKLLSSGERQICEFLVPGDLMGFESHWEHYFSAEAVSDTILMRYSRRTAERLISEDPAAARFVRNLTSSSLQGAYERMMLLCHKSAKGRMAWFLLEMAARSKSEDRDLVDLPMTRSDIAAYLGMVIETVSRALAQLRKRGVIAMRGHRIQLIDRAGLAHIADAT